MAEKRKNTVNWNHGWLFSRECGQDFIKPDFDDGAWQPVDLPHTANIEPVDVYRHWQGECGYRKHFCLDVPSSERVCLYFEGAMHVTTVYCNGVLLKKHEGGYLPFEVDLTDTLCQGENVVAVLVDNRDYTDIPPGKTLDTVDFCYFGGIYRNVWLRTVGEIYISDAVSANRVAGGGVFFTFSDISDQSSAIHTKVEIINRSSSVRTVHCRLVLNNKDGRSVLVCEDEITIDPNSFKEAQMDGTVLSPMLWSPESPVLYSAVVTVTENDYVHDSLETTVGIRHLSLIDGDFYLNGQQYIIRGTNRHQQYPYIGNAASDNAQYRDAKKLKNAGFNFVRLSHYPQSVAFLDACDELGLLVMEATPGWQWCQVGKFQELTFQNIRDMIRRDRNHPCIVFWELSLNETGDTEEFVWGGWSGATDEFYIRCKEAAKAEYPTDQMLTAGDTNGRRDPVRVGFDLPFAQWDQERGCAHLDAIPGKKALMREYADFEFGGNESSSRQPYEANEDMQLLQTWNVQWSLNKLLASDWAMGSATWVGIDYNRGYYSARPICECGALDTFRLPKFVYHFFQSQQAVETQPIVYLATYWLPGSNHRRVVVFSNCDEVALYVNGQCVERRKPDDGPDTEYLIPREQCDPNYWMQQKAVAEVQFGEEQRAAIRAAVAEALNNRSEGFYDRTNSRHLPHPPFTFLNVPYTPGCVEAVGYCDGKEVCRDVRHTPGEAVAIRLEIDDSGRSLRADGSDFVFVRAWVVDEQGTVCRKAKGTIEFRVKGPAVLVGAHTLDIKGGVATAVVQAATVAGRIEVIAAKSNVGVAREIINSVGE